MSAVAADHPPSFTNRVEMMDRIKTLDGEKKVRERTEKDSAMAEKDAAVAERDRSIAELKEIQSDINNLHSIEVDALQLVNADLKADIEHLQATISANKSEQKAMKQAMEEQHQASINNCQERLVSQHQHEIDLIKRNHHEEIEALKHSYQSDIQALEERQTLQLKALKEEHHTVKQLLVEQNQAQLESKMSELSAKDALISSKSSTIQSLLVKLGQALGTSSSKDNLFVFSPGVKLTFTECAKAPGTVYGLDHGITLGKNVYVGVSNDGKVFKYSITEETWSTLPIAPVKYARIGCLCEKIVTVGGRLLSNQVTADIHEFHNASQQWVKSTTIPSMPTARAAVTAVSWSSPPALIVCGGSDQQYQPLTIVEVYHSRTSQWHAISPLPFPRVGMTHTVIHNLLYLIGGQEGRGLSTDKKTVVSTSIPQLLEICLQPSAIQWKSFPIPDVPTCWSTAASLGGCLLVVGGVNDRNWPPKPDSVVSSVHAYCPFTSSWVLVGELPQPLCLCVTATLPTGELLVIGGVTSAGSDAHNNFMAINTAYKCPLLMQ